MGRALLDRVVATCRDDGFRLMIAVIGDSRQFRLHHPAPARRLPLLRHHPLGRLQVRPLARQRRSWSCRWARATPPRPMRERSCGRRPGRLQRHSRGWAPNSTSHRSHRAPARASMQARRPRIDPMYMTRKVAKADLVGRWALPDRVFFALRGLPHPGLRVSRKVSHCRRFAPIWIKPSVGYHRQPHRRRRRRRRLRLSRLLAVGTVARSHDEKDQETVARLERGADRAAERRARIGCKVSPVPRPVAEGAEAVPARCAAARPRVSRALPGTGARQDEPTCRLSRSPASSA